MEMMAVIQALEALKRPSRLRVTTDSRYVHDGATRWLSGWKASGWKTADKKPVKNQDLWQRLDTALAVHQVTFAWTRGHAGHVENERADRLAQAAAQTAGHRSRQKMPL